jgi:signal transduction histidine kinase
MRRGQAGTIAGIALLTDVIFSLVLVRQAESLGASFYPLYVLLALRTLSIYTVTPAATIIPFVLGPIYLFTLYSPITPVSSAEQIARWALLLGSLGFGIIGIWTNTMSVRTNTVLRQELRNAHRAADLRVAQLEQTANDLRTRMREQHALEEGLRVITSSLSLDEVLSQIIDSTVQMLGVGRVQGVALSLANGQGFEHRSFELDGYLPNALSDAIATRIVDQQSPLIIGDLSFDAGLHVSETHNAVSVLAVPLFVGDGAPRGALAVVSSSYNAFASSDARHLTALAMQAGIAIQNAELHSHIQQQRQLLEAVLRDMTDGLVVLDAQQQIVLTNPLGRTLMDSSAASTVREQVMSLATSMRSESKHILTREIRIGAEDNEDAQVYEALGTLVRQHGAEEPLIAIVLHNITHQKVEERHRTEFISMVAHELRNPLNSMNGFVKIVLQGRAGQLSEMQHEFLEIVDSQIELLKGRISELLEYNRLEAGKLALNPQWADLPVLIAGTITRLSLQAENAGLRLLNEVDASLPECYFDSERIGQVLTNLVENAIKATPPGGTIRVCSEHQENELWVRVYDTGVGIAPEDKHKIFQAFYRAHDRTSSKGNHLGLGLAICQQIVEGHRGRLWVESELGKGSCFSFALPLFDNERTLGD